MPRIETFLLSSVLLSFRAIAVQTVQLLKHARKLVERRQARHGRRRLYFPRKMNWKKWLSLVGEDDPMTLPQNARKGPRTGEIVNSAKGDKDDEDDDDSILGRPVLPSKLDEEASVNAASTHNPPASPNQRDTAKSRSSKKDEVRQTKTTPSYRVRSADLVESIVSSEHLGYAIKLAVAVFLVSFPAFYGPWVSWYSSSRANWASLQLVLVFEVAIGSSFWIFFVRAFGVAFGCVWGYAAYEISRGILPVLVIFIFIGIIPSAYVQLATPYVKAGMISIVSMCVVALGKLAGVDEITKRDADGHSHHSQH
jgi:hypothetical protein